MKNVVRQRGRPIGCFASTDYVDGEFHDLFVQPLLDSDLSALGQTRLLQGLDWRVIDGLADVHTRIHAPVRLVWGTNDPFFPIARARSMLAEFAGGAELCEISGAKLFAHEDHPEQFLAHTRSFLEKCSG
jgi:pimeloyl-ACP methyl ester carboxylesterase